MVVEVPQFTAGACFGRPGGTHMNVLLIEDSRFFQRVIDKELTQAGHHVVCVGNGDEGLKVARQSMPDVILLDIMLPGLPGTSILGALKRNPITAKIPIIALSGMSQMNGEKLVRDGANVFISKSTLGSDAGQTTLLNAVQQVLPPAKSTEQMD